MGGLVKSCHLCFSGGQQEAAPCRPISETFIFFRFFCRFIMSPQLSLTTALLLYGDGLRRSGYGRLYLVHEAKEELG